MTDDARTEHDIAPPASSPARAPLLPAPVEARSASSRGTPRNALLAGCLTTVIASAALIGGCIFIVLPRLEREGVSTPSFGHQSQPVRPAIQPGWIGRYNGPGNGGDSARAVAVDASGNIYATGISYGGVTAHDFATVRYAPDGSQRWVSRYNGPTNGDDEALAIAVDPQGNVVVTGYSDGGSTGLDYATVKYAQDGAQLWAARYEGRANDVPDAMAIDPDGNVVVTGQSGADYATVKYAADGAQLWLDVFHGPADDAVPGGTPTPCAGSLGVPAGPAILSGAPVSLAVDSGGNAYVSGTATRCSADYVTIKYDRQGSRASVVTYDGPEHVPGRFAFDDVRQPINDHATAIAADATGAVYVTGSSDRNFRTVKYDSNGHQSWVASYDGPSDSADEPRVAKVAPDGSIYVTGFSCCGDGLFLVVLKYRPDGRLLWARRVDNPGDDVPKAMAVDTNGGVAIASEMPWSIFPVPGVYADYLVAKFSGDGTWQWMATYDGPAARTDSPGGIAIGPDGRVYVTGTSDGGGTDHDYATLEYAP